MGAAITFNYTNWIAAFPQFSNVPQATVVNTVAPIAQSYCRIDGSGPVNDSTTLTNLFNLMVAHVTQLLFGSSIQPINTAAVGRLASASEGSVSASFDFPTTASNAWFLQTQYGAMYWAMAAPYRTMRYLRGRRSYCRPF